MSQKYILTQDCSSHWYVIPADKEDEWSKYNDAAERYWDDCRNDEEPPVEPEWADMVGGAPSLVVFGNYEIT